MTSQLEDRVGKALHDLVDDREFAIDLDAIERRGRRANLQTTLTRAGVTLTVAAVAAAAVGIAGTGSGGHVPSTATAIPSALNQLADYVLAGDTHPAGDATKVVRTTTLTGKAPTIGADLYADNGDYFYSDDPADLPSRVKAHENLANGVFGRDVAAAERAATGDLATAKKQMAVAALDPGKPYRLITHDEPVSIPSGLTAARKKEYVVSRAASSKVALVNLDSSAWSNSLDALIAGAGRPEVRAGVVKILSTLPDVTLTPSTTAGAPTLTLTESFTSSSGTYVETLVIGAKDGVPVKLIGGDKGKASSVTITYQVSRETLSDLG